MMAQQIYKENGPYGSVLVAPCPAGFRLVDYQLQLLMRHRPDWLLPAYVRYRDGVPQICLETSACLPLDEAFPSLAREDFAGQRILADLASLLQKSLDLLLPQDQFSLHPSLVFLDGAGKIKLAFWPCRQEEPAGEQNDELPGFCTSIGRAFSWQEEDIQSLAKAARQGPADLAAWLDKTSSHEARPENKPDDQPGQIKSMQKSIKLFRQNLLPAGSFILHAALIIWTGLVVLAGIWLKSRPFLLPATVCLAGANLLFWQAGRKKDPAAKTKNASLGLSLYWQKLAGHLAAGEPASAGQDQTVLLPKDNDFRMAMLSEGQPGTPAEHEGIRAFILVDEFIIGRDAQKSDLCLPDQAVGRMHARILRRASSFFIHDLGSGNGTELDGKKLARHEDQLLPDSCLLSFAGREFYFTAD